MEAITSMFELGFSIYSSARWEGALLSGFY
jgi:hypothetical protein